MTDVTLKRLDVTELKNGDMLIIQVESSSEFNTVARLRESIEEYVKKNMNIDIEVVTTYCKVDFRVLRQSSCSKDVQNVKLPNNSKCPFCDTDDLEVPY